jgi:hypothetical protein
MAASRCCFALENPLIGVLPVVVKTEPFDVSSDLSQPQGGQELQRPWC